MQLLPSSKSDKTSGKRTVTDKAEQTTSFHIFFFSATRGIRNAARTSAAAAAAAARAPWNVAGRGARKFWAATRTKAVALMERNETERRFSARLRRVDTNASTEDKPNVPSPDLKQASNTLERERIARTRHHQELFAGFFVVVYCLITQFFAFIGGVIYERANVCR